LSHPVHMIIMANNERRCKNLNGFVSDLQLSSERDETFVEFVQKNRQVCSCNTQSASTLNQRSQHIAFSAKFHLGLTSS